MIWFLVGCIFGFVMICIVMFWSLLGVGDLFWDCNFDWLKLCEGWVLGKSDRDEVMIKVLDLESM